MKKLLFIMLFMGASYVFAAPAPTVQDLVPDAGTKAPKNFALYNQELREYDSRGQLVKKTVTTDKGTAEAVTKTYEYDGAGKLVKENIYLNGELDDFITYEYNKDGTLAKETEFGAKGKIKNFKTYTYLDGGKKVERKHIKADGVYYRYVVKYYDASGNLLEHSEYRIK